MKRCNFQSKQGKLYEQSSHNRLQFTVIYTIFTVISQHCIVDHDNMNILEAISFTIQSKPSTNPESVKAEHANILK
jgi:hypothetical protein